MKPLLTLAFTFLFCATFHAQVPSTSAPPLSQPTQSTPVPMSEEPHHQLVLQNSIVRVYNVQVSPLDATLLHRHDLPYLSVSLGLAQFIDAVQGKPEAHVLLQDGELHYSPGGFAHVLRTDTGLPFRKITVELVRPQGALRNICGKVIDGPLGGCAASASDPKKRNSNEPLPEIVPYFETDELKLDLVTVEDGRNYTDAAPARDSLLIALQNANLDVELAGEHITFLHGGDIVWLPAGKERKVVDFLGTRSHFLLVTFNDSGKSSGPH